MNIGKKHRILLGGISIVIGMISSCIPLYDSKALIIFTNRTNDTLIIGASHDDTIDSVSYPLFPFYLPIDSGHYSSNAILWNGVDVRENIIYPDSSFTIDGNYLFENTDTCYFFLVKWKDAKNHSWDEIRTKKLYRRRIIVRNADGKFDRTIQ